ncbi:hypothetical protein PV10_04825 [Exophiala mesophila]|uniref:CCAAT-binding factor domain-containing protein n=1 Tax=Exophiala mesophila TaxID=212818 RepID=A0A0D1ZIB3_EXOME|nr:uncharacterized protein PV10_04825 [Exophiala mesophila]KIV93624.1 hypothetical protein PV10_04825 [Exophiala mesophila]
MAKTQSKGQDPPVSSGAENDVSLTSTTQPSTDAFKDLRSKIQAQFQTIDRKKKTPKGKANDEKADKSKTTEPQEEEATSGKRGKKRERNGKVKPEVSSTSTQPTDTIADADEEFLAEVKLLGGTSEDLDLIADVETDSEVEGDIEAPQKSHPKRKSEDLDKGIHNILKEIALAQGDVEADEDISEEEPSDDDEPQSTSKVTTQKITKIERGKPSNYICELKPDWFNIEQPKFDSNAQIKFRVPAATIDELHAYAKHLLDEENRKLRAAQQSSSSQSFYNTVIASGTLSDKISALTLAVQDSPIHNVRALETLIGLAGKRSRSQAVDVLRSLKDLFAQGSLLPESRRLYAFASQPALPHLFTKTKQWKRGEKLPRGLTEQHLVVWAYEDWLKEQYFEVLKILEVWCNDEIEFSKSKALSFVYELLKEKPEQESNLLRLLVNKLGDPVKKIASQASYLLMQLLIHHPAMKPIVVAAIETDFIFRPGQTLHAKYYAVVTLNQTTLSTREEEVAIKLLDIYFGLFTILLKSYELPEAPVAEEEPHDEQEPRRRKKPKKPKAPAQPQAEDLREKLTSAVLTGVNRAYPYAGDSHKSFSDHIETLFRITHSSNFNTSIQAMLLIQQLSTTHKSSNDRFYRVLYETLLDPRLLSASKQQLYLNLLHRALKADLNQKRVKAFVKRLIQVLSLHDSSFIVGAFFLLQDLKSTFPSLAGLFDEPEDHDDEEEVFRDVEEDGQPAQDLGTSDGHVRLYDGHKRAPEHANADNSCAWEVLPFLAHFHPAVSLSADHTLRHAKLPGKPDLSLHTLSHFLDRFVYRNPKLSGTGLKGSSIMQPMAAADSQGVLIGDSSGARRKVPVNSEEFLVKKDVAAEEVFFHQYFASLGKAPLKKALKKRDDEDESDDEDEVFKAMMDSAPDLEGDEESDDDLDLSELDAEMDASDAGEGVSDDEGVDIDPALFDESEDDLMDLDEGVTLETEEFGGFDETDEEEMPAKKKKSKAAKQEKARKKALPTFASVEDYAKLIEDDENEDF